MEHNSLAGQLLVVILGEGDVDVLLLAGGHAHHLLLKAGDELAGAQLQVKVLALAALEGHAIVEALEVDVGGVAHLSGPVNGLSGGNVLSHPIQLGLNLLVGDGSLGLLYLKALVLAQGDLRIDLGGQGQGDGAVVLDLHIGQAGTADGLEALLLGNGKVINLGENLLQAVFVENVSAVQSLDHLPGSLALPEAGNQNLLAGLQISLVDAGLHQILVDFHHDGGLVAVSFNVLYVHWLLSS